MISANAAVIPRCPTGVPSSACEAGRPVRLPRPMTQWRFDAVALWTGLRSPFGLNGTRRISPLHRLISTGSVPGSNPQQTGWWTIGLGLRETKPDVYEWRVSGEKRQCFWTLAACRRALAAGATLPRSRTGLLPYGCLARISPAGMSGRTASLNLHKRKSNTARS